MAKDEIIQGSADAPGIRRGVQAPGYAKHTDANGYAIFNDRRPEPVAPQPKRKDELHGHLINDHQHVGLSAKPSMAELRLAHEDLHFDAERYGATAPDRHIHPQEVERRAKGWPLTNRDGAC